MLQIFTMKYISQETLIFYVLISLKHPNIFYEFLIFSSKLFDSDFFPCDQVLQGIHNINLVFNAKNLKLFFKIQYQLTCLNIS